MFLLLLPLSFSSGLDLLSDWSDLVANMVMFVYIGSKPKLPWSGRKWKRSNEDVDYLRRLQMLRAAAEVVVSVSMELRLLNRCVAVAAVRRMVVMVLVRR